MTSPTTKNPTAPQFEATDKKQPNEATSQQTPQPQVAHSANRHALIPREKHADWLKRLAQMGGLASIENAHQDNVFKKMGF